MRLATLLLRPEDRATAARELAERLGGELLLIFVRDPEIGALLPAPGFPQTLADGRAWHGFLTACLKTGNQTGTLRAVPGAGPLPAFGLATGEDAVLVLLGATTVSDELVSLHHLLPVLAAAFRSEYLAATAAVQGRLAREAAEQASGLSRTLEAARSALQEALQRGEAGRAKLEAANQELREQADALEGANERLQDQAAELEVQTEELQSTAEELRHQAEARETMARALLDKERQFRILAESIPHLAWMAEPDGYIFWYNQRWYDYTGTTPEQMAGWGWQSVHDPGELPRVLDRWRASIRTGEPFEIEFPIRGEDGRFRWFLTRSVPVKDADRQVVRWFGTNTNIDEQRAAARALQERQERLEAALHASGTGTFRWDIRTNALEGDESLDRLLGLGPGMTTRSLEQFVALVHPEDRTRVVRACERCATEGGDFDEEFRVIWPDGTVHWLDDKGKTFLGATGNPLYMTGACVDITDRVRSEQQLRQAQRLQAVGTLAGGVAHEVNNQMTAVLGLGEFALRGLGAEHPQSNDVHEMIKAAQRAAGVTQQLLAFSRRQMRQPRMLDLAAVVEELRLVLTRLLGADKSLVIVPSRSRRLIQADPSQLEQILINLAANARDAMPPGGRLTITLEDVVLDQAYAGTRGGIRLVPGPYVLLAVSDDGIGMDRETLGQIFEPFFTTKPIGQGTGLGLSMVYGIVKQHGGYIWAYSEPAVGTTIKVYLPTVPSLVRDESSSSTGTAEPAQATAGRATILVVEDEPSVRVLARRALESAGYTVLEAKHGREALQLVNALAELPALVVTDVIMPELTGRELSDALKRGGASVPVLYMSGYTGDDVLLRGLIPEEAPFLQKPFTPGALLRRVEEQLARSQSVDRSAGG